MYSALETNAAVLQNQHLKSGEEIKLLKYIKKCMELDNEKVQEMMSKLNDYRAINRNVKQCHFIQDGILFSLSILCIFCEFIMLIEYYSYSSLGNYHMIFFLISLSIIILSQLWNYFLFWNTKLQINKYEQYDQYIQFILSVCATPTSPFFTYFSFLYFDSTKVYIGWLFREGIYANIKSVRAKSGVGFAFQCLFDIFPQSILLLIYILLHSNNNLSISMSCYISFIAFILFISYIIYWFLIINEINITKNKKILFFNFLIITIDLFAIYVMIIFMFHFYNFLPFQLWYILNGFVGIIVPMIYVLIKNNADEDWLWYLWSICCMFTCGLIITILSFIIMDILSLIMIIYLLNDLFFNCIHLLPPINNQYFWLLVEFISEDNSVTRLCYINAMRHNIYDTKYYFKNETNAKLEFKSYLLNNYHSSFKNATLRNMRIECRITFNKMLSLNGKSFKGNKLNTISSIILQTFLAFKSIKILLIVPIFSSILLFEYYLNNIIIALLITTMVLMLLLLIAFITISKQLYFAYHLQMTSFTPNLSYLTYNFNIFNAERIVNDICGECISNIIMEYGIEPLLFDLNNDKDKTLVYDTGHSSNSMWDKNNKNVLNLTQLHNAVSIYLYRMKLFYNCIIEFECLFKTDSLNNSGKMDILFVDVAEYGYCLFIAVRNVGRNQLKFQCGFTQRTIYNRIPRYHVNISDDTIAIMENDIISISLNANEIEQQWISLYVSCETISSVINFGVNEQNEKLLFDHKKIGFKRDIQISNDFRGCIRNVAIDGF